MPDWKEKLEMDYSSNISKYQSLRDEFIKQLNELISENNIHLASPIETRIKTINSLTDKCERCNITPTKINEIFDIAGFRIVLVFIDDLVTVCNIVEEHFNIIEKEDTKSRLSEDQFGYGSIHYVISPPELWLNVPTLKKLRGLNAEIQIRTASQHIWATASHALQYKQEQDVPKPIRRSITRVAALLETVDLEFSRVLTERKEYVSEVIDSKDVEKLNTETLRILLDSVLPEENKDENENYSELLSELRLLEIETTGELRNIITSNLDKVLKEDANLLISETKRLNDSNISLPQRLLDGVFFTHIGFVRTALSLNDGNLNFPLDTHRYKKKVAKKRVVKKKATKKKAAKKKATKKKATKKKATKKKAAKKKATKKKTTKKKATKKKATKKKATKKKTTKKKSAKKRKRK